MWRDNSNDHEIIYARISEISKKWKNSFQEELICPVCLNAFVSPVELPCKDVFCHACLNQAWDQKTKNVKCLVCKCMYSECPVMLRNISLTRVVKVFSPHIMVNTYPALQCTMCSKGPAGPGWKFCLCCRAPLCKEHLKIHLQQPSPSSTKCGHLIVPIEDVEDWTCQKHNAYKIYYCEKEKKVVCKNCLPKCEVKRSHAVCYVKEHQNNLRQMLQSQQTKIKDRMQDIEKQLAMLESDKRQAEGKKLQLMKQYEMAGQPLNKDIQKSLELLNAAQKKFFHYNTCLVLQLKEQLMEASKLQHIVEKMLDEVKSIDFIKNTPAVKVFIKRSNKFMSTELPESKDRIKYKYLLSKISKQEKVLKKTLEEVVTPPQRRCFTTCSQSSRLKIMSAKCPEIAKKWKNSFQEELICPVCLKAFVNPIELPCKDVFCQACLSQAWGQKTEDVECPVCKYIYLECLVPQKSISLTRVIDNFSPQFVKNASLALQCTMCTGHADRVWKVCLCCNASFCKQHLESHLQQPSPNSSKCGHLIVPIEDVEDWTCEKHNAYKIYYCEKEKRVVCKYCLQKCEVRRGHAACYVQEHQNNLRQMLQSQQNKIKDRVQDIEKQLAMLEFDKQQAEGKKLQLMKQYEMAGQPLNKDIQKSLELLNAAQKKFFHYNTFLVLQLKEQLMEASKLQHIVEKMLDEVNSIDFMKNTPAVNVFIKRSSQFISSEVPEFKLLIKNQNLLSKVSKQEKVLKKMLEEAVTPPQRRCFTTFLRIFRKGL